MDYALVTPARNEEQFIENTIMSVVRQTKLPKKWVIVNDRSVDRTGAIVQGYAKRFDFIELVERKEISERNFAAKARAISDGLGSLKKVRYGLIGNLDADVTFDKTYFETLIEKFKRNQKLGLAGGKIHELVGKSFVPQNISHNSVAGAVQLFRRECFEQIGGYFPLKTGGIDAVAEIMARMHGWEVQTLTFLRVFHHRRVAKAGSSILKARLRQGRMYYHLGYHPAFQIIRSFNRLKDPPFVLGSIAILLGYLLPYIKSEKRELPERFILFLQDEQKQRIRDLLRIDRYLVNTEGLQ